MSENDKLKHFGKRNKQTLQNSKQLPSIANGLAYAVLTSFYSMGWIDG